MVVEYGTRLWRLYPHAGGHHYHYDCPLLILHDHHGDTRYSWLSFPLYFIDSYDLQYSFETATTILL